MLEQYWPSGTARADRAGRAHRDPAAGRQSRKRSVPTGSSIALRPSTSTGQPRSSSTSVRRSASTSSRPRANSSAVRSHRVSRCPPMRRRHGRRLCGASSWPGRGRSSARTPSNACRPARCSDSRAWSTGWCSRIREDVDGFGGDDVAVVATGHSGPLLLPDMHTVQHYDQHLTLDGLRLVFERNRDSQRGRLKQARLIDSRQKNVRIRSTTRSSRRAPGSSAICRTWCTGARCRTAASRRPRRRRLGPASGRRAGR